MTSFCQRIHASSIDQTSLKPDTSKCGHILIALGVIVLIGSLVANGLLYSQLGDTSFSIGVVG